ncbi:2-oxoacid:acceptor oxidoreductase family protein, partial [Patescibacteria group bacterium]|nr:2-oxoacid:acceptor oxidoreductase family protein [Patescibacteria group bacterium]
MMMLKRGSSMNGLTIAVSGIQLVNGAETTSGIIARTFFRAGARVVRFGDYLSTIYGGKMGTGTTVYLVRAADQDISCPGDEQWDILICLQLGNEKKILPVCATNYLNRMKPNGVVLYDTTKSGVAQNELCEELHLELLGIPALGIVGKTYPGEDTQKTNLMRNGALVGAAFALLGFDVNLKRYRVALQETFGEKKSSVVEKNMALAQKGIEAYRESTYGKTHGAPSPLFAAEPEIKRLLLRGNDAIFLAPQLLGPPVFYGSYPITPASDILKSNEEYNRPPFGVTMQMEDEIAALGAAIGAAYGGAVASTATSGPGFDLMGEMIGHASVLEIPVVIFDIQRAGPSTGMPTKTEQSDLWCALKTGHGEFPRIVLAPGDVEEHFYESARAFYLAWKYRVPVIVLSSLEVAEGHQTPNYFDLVKIAPYQSFFANFALPEHGKQFYPFEITDSGISPFTIPGNPGTMCMVNGTEHWIDGRVSTNRERRIMMMDKRARKLATCLHEDTRGPACYGNEKAAIALIGWGVTKGALIEAQERLGASGLETKVLHYIDIFPFPKIRTKRLIQNIKKAFVVEGNKEGQFAEYLAGAMGRMGVACSEDRFVGINRYDGAPIEP